MVYLDPSELRWLPYVKTWISKISKTLGRKELPKILLNLFETYVDPGFKFVHKYCDQAIAQVYNFLSPQSN